MNTFPLAQIFSWCLIASVVVMIDTRVITRTLPTGAVNCPTDSGDPNQNATLLPNPYNCSTYFVCDHGHPTEVPCPGDLYFDPILRVCNYQDQVNCNINNLMPNLIPCNNGNGTAQYFPNPLDCSSFLVCDPGSKFATLEYCPGDLLFNPELDVCDYPENVNCSVEGV